MLVLRRWSTRLSRAAKQGALSIGKKLPKGGGAKEVEALIDGVKATGSPHVKQPGHNMLPRQHAQNFS